MSSWWSEHPDLESVARRGRSELDEESVAAEQDAELLRKRRRTLEQMCFEWMSRGDLVTIAVTGRSFEGQLTAVVNDLAVMTTKTIDVAINITLAGLIRSDTRAVFAGTTGERSVSSFRAQLGRYEVDASPVRLIGEPFDVVGVIEASTDDHVVLRDAQGVEWALPRTRIAAAIRT
ncbi:MAG: hypothetical protein GY926_22985 [bacterium]|nr:hypothetical protein [bacterium]MCP4968087.1 hypothetical protein [bacterium]